MKQKARYHWRRPLIKASISFVDSRDSLKTRAAKKIRLQLDDGIPLVIKYGWSGQTYTLEDCKFNSREYSHVEKQCRSDLATLSISCTRRHLIRIPYS